MPARPGPGKAVDAQGAPAVDPTKNVLDLVEATVERLDDLLEAAVKRLDDLRALDHDHIRQLAEMRAAHDRELRLAEASRVDAIRAVDIAAVQRASEVSADQAKALADQVAASAEAMRNQVDAAATAAQIGLTDALQPMKADIADLRRAQYEAQGVKAQTGDTRLNVGAVLGAVSVLLVLVFGVASVALALR